MKKVLLPLFLVTLVCLVSDTSTHAITATTTTSPETPPWLGNISTRSFVQTTDNVMIGGLIIKGTEPKTVIVRAIGPELGAPPYNVPNALADPTLELHDDTGALIASNDNWQHTIIGGIISSSQVSAIQSSGKAPTNATESAIIATLQPGNYTAIVRGTNNTTGVGLVEAYDLSASANTVLGNISTRAFVQTGDNVMIGGFIVEGAAPKRVIVRAIGPELTQYGVANALADPALELHDGNGALIASNDNWQTTILGGIISADQVDDIKTSGFVPTALAESAIVATLQPGNYTAIMRGQNASTGVGLVEVYDLDWDENPSPAVITLDGVSETAFNSTGSSLRFDITNETFSTAPDDIYLYQNGIFVPVSSIHVTASEVVVDPILIEGRNDIIFAGNDSHGRLIYKEFTLWAGDNVLQGSIVDQNNQPVTGAAISLVLGDDHDVIATTTSANGNFTFASLPGRTVTLTATASGNRLASAGINGADGFVQLKLDAIGPPSLIDNNDFSLGTQGWAIGTAPVQIVPHIEGPSAAAKGVTSPATDMDLVLTTQGEGPQSISRTFYPNAGTKNITVRYRFITSEVPGGYFGTQFNDSFNVSIRSQSGGGVISESNSMNELGLGAFDANGATAWREGSLPLNADGDVVQVDLTVANVADGLLDSQLVIDLIDEKKISITSLTLNDIDAGPLNYLSTDGTNPYFGGNTRVHGTVTVEGASDDGLQSLALEVIQAGSVVATADLAQTAQTVLLKSFGPSQKVEITSTQLLFELVSAQAGNVDISNDGTLSLRVRATSTNGQTATRDYGAVQLLRRYTGANRYGGRDEGQGGDDWARPSLRDLAGNFAAVTWGDFSNMNGGLFQPHGSHQKGLDVDGYFMNYEMRDAATAQTMIQYLNNPTYGSEIILVGVTFSKTGPNTAFWNAIKNVTLDDGRSASDVIQPWAGHTGHFHWRVNGN